MSTTDVAADVLDGDWDPDAWWSTTNFGEAIPGVLTPLTWSFWGTLGERAARSAFAAIGAISEAESIVPEDPHDRAFGIFHGRFAGKVDFLALVGDRLPGTTGAAVAEQILGELPPDFVSRPTRRRWPAVARRLPVFILTLPRRLAALQAETARWWTIEISRAPTLDLDAARQQWREASARFEEVMSTHVSCLLAGVQPVYDQVQRLAERAGAPELAARVTTGQGSHAELALVEDLWSLSREQLSMEEFLARHGYHGPFEGELASQVWREDSGPVLATAARYRGAPDTDSPAAMAARNVIAQGNARAELLRRLPRHRRGAARLVLVLADRYLPLRGIGKVAFLQTLDVARAASRQIGHHLAAAGVIDDAQDACFLTGEELLTARPPASLSEAVTARRERREEDKRLALPSSWRGRPVPLVADTGSGPDTGDGDDHGGGEIRLCGIGASPGVAEGPVRVVLDPTFEDVEPGEILVAPTTDPSWASVLFTSSALVVDLGGQLSHAAVVARELGIPCVMGTGDGTRRLRTGDVCRVNGQDGTVELLERA